MGREPPAQQTRLTNLVARIHPTPRSVRDAISPCPLILSAVRLGVRDRILGDDGDLSLVAGAATDMSASVEHVRPGCSRGDSHFHGHADIGVDVSSGFKRLPELQLCFESGRNPATSTAVRDLIAAA